MFISSREHSVKLGEIKSKRHFDLGSAKILEMYYQESEHELGLITSNVLEADSLTSNMLDMPESGYQSGQKKQINFDLVSLPDNKDLCGSWRLFLDLDSPMYSERDLNKRKFSSFQDLRSVLPEKSGNKETTEMENATQMKLKLIGISGGEFGDEDKQMVFYLEQENGETVKVTNQDQNEFFSKIYRDMLESGQTKEELKNRAFKIDYDPKQAMVVLNESFNFDTNIKKMVTMELPETESLASLKETITPKAVACLPGVKHKKKRRVYSKMSVLRRESELEVVTEKLSEGLQKIDSVKLINTEETTQKSTREESEIRISVHKPPNLFGLDRNRKSTFGNRGNQLRLYDDSLSGDSSSNASEEEEEDLIKKDIRIRVEVEIKREIWMSLRMGPVLSYAKKIKENMKDMGFEIKFIEDLQLINED